MKIYFAGPLFTPYVRQFISEHAQILRDNGIDPFVPHESFKADVPAAVLESLFARGLLKREQLEKHTPNQLVQELIRSGSMTREQLGLPPITPKTIFGVDYAGLSSANAVLAILDGTQVDDGTACEIGIFYGLMRSDPSKKGIAGLMTDSRGTRRMEHGWGLNLFTLGVILEGGAIFSSFEGALTQLKTWDAELRSGH
jgi:nucleoside 2-deoxyribosyltransferase